MSLYNFKDQLSESEVAYKKVSGELEQSRQLKNELIASNYANLGSEVKESYDDDDYANAGNKGDRKANRQTKRAIKRTKNESDKDDDDSEEGEGLTGDTAMDGAVFGMGIAQNMTSVAGSQAESWQQTGQTTIQGAELGMKVAGPWGAAIGAGVGLVAGVVDYFGDTAKRNAIERKSINENNEKIETQREAQSSLAKKESQIDKMIGLRKSQLNYINPKY